jgi:hypothetical protein
MGTMQRPWVGKVGHETSIDAPRRIRRAHAEQLSLVNVKPLWCWLCAASASPVIRAWCGSAVTGRTGHALKPGHAYKRTPSAGCRKMWHPTDAISAVRNPKRQ